MWSATFPHVSPGMDSSSCCFGYLLIVACVTCLLKYYTSLACLMHIPLPDYLIGCTHCDSSLTVWFHLFIIIAINTSYQRWCLVCLNNIKGFLPFCSNIFVDRTTCCLFFRAVFFFVSYNFLEQRETLGYPTHIFVQPPWNFTESLF